MRALPFRQSESAADCSDEGALSEKRGFRTRNRLLKEGTFLFCHPERSRPQGGAVASFCVTLSEPPNGGESNGSEPFHMLAICSLCCLADCIRLSTHSAQIPRLRSG